MISRYRWSTAPAADILVDTSLDQIVVTGTRRACGALLKAADISAASIRHRGINKWLQRVLLLGMVIAPPAVAARNTEISRSHGHVLHVTIIRDHWGIAHIYGKSDADTVFGAMYAQAEDDFARIERNYLNGLGWLAQAEGDQALYSDLRQRLFVDSKKLQFYFRASPLWLQKLLVAWADGLNYYVTLHPMKPKVIHHFEPWMALSFTEGSIGGDIETVELDKLEAFYSHHPVASQIKVPGTTGSNGFAIAPRLSATGHALLWINPHTSFYFRSELQMVSEEKLNVYGAATWGQFFIYQGFNDRNGWMHPSYGGDAIDEYAETIVKRPDGLYYRYGTGLRKMSVSRVAIPYKNDGKMAKRVFTVYRSHHGPIIREDDGKWIAIKLLQDPIRTLEQSYLRTKTRDFKSFYKIQEMRGDSSNNTVYADADGNIGYFHGNFIPKRNAKFDFTHPVDGSDPETEWQGAHDIKDTITLLNPTNGWIQNTNNSPFTAAGPESPKRGDYPAYMSSTEENARGIHALELLPHMHDVTLESLIATGYDSHLTAFEVLLPRLFNAYDQLPASDPRRSELHDSIELLRGWNRRTSLDSLATTLAIFWGQALIDAKGASAQNSDEPVFEFLVNCNDDESLRGLSAALNKLQTDFGRWQIPWGEINRFQRVTDDLSQPFSDTKPSVPVAMASAHWGALASFDWTRPLDTKRLYGSFGNSFVAAVEFAPRVRAKAISAGGESGDAASPHFADQITMYSKGEFRDVYFYKEDVLAHSERRYHPGE